MTDYTLLRDQLLALAEDVEYEITNLSNASALLYHSLEGLNWAGFTVEGREPDPGAVPGKTGLYQDPAGPRRLRNGRQKRTRRCGWRTSTSFPDILHVTAPPIPRS